MTCSRCGVRHAEERANLCARCLLLIADIDAEDLVIDGTDQTLPCELLSIIGETERAITFLGEQTWPVRRLVALKLFKPAASARFNEAQARRPVPSHPAIAPVLESGYVGGQPYVMTPFVGGGPVALRYTHPSMAVATRLQALLAITDALVFAHAQGAPHGRLVASNVLCAGLAPFAVQIIDFGCNARKATALEPVDALVRDDIAAGVALADLLLDKVAPQSRQALARLQPSAISALELRSALEDLQARIVPSHGGA